MVILSWLILRFLLVAAAVWAVYYIVKTIRESETIQIFTDGVKNALRDCGLTQRRHRYPVELYKWILPPDSDCCQDCMERASWPAMDIADWMDEGLPGTPEADTECSSHCRCQLVLFKRTFAKQREGELY